MIVHGSRNAPKTGEFYIISPDFDAPLREVEFVNARELRPDGQGMMRPPSGGFPALDEVPLLQETSREFTLSDFHVGFEGYWLISQSLKHVLESVDPSGFEFAQCEFRRFDGSIGPAHYLCDVTRALDAIDDDASDVEVLKEGFPRGKFYNIAGGARLAFRRDVVGGAHIFRSPFDRSLVICDRILRDALIEGGFGQLGEGRGMALYDAADY